MEDIIPPSLPPSPPPMNVGDESDKHGSVSLSEPSEGLELEAGGNGGKADLDGTDATEDDLTALDGPAPPVSETVMKWWYVRLCQTPEIGPPLPPLSRQQCHTVIIAERQAGLDLRDICAMDGTRSAH
eukprot:6182923-Pleurochrysis_carterae.AAC.2